MIGHHRWPLLIIAFLLLIPAIAPPPTVAEPATQLYIAHFARFTAQIPADWTVDPTGTYDYVGPGGFVDDGSFSGASLDEICTSLSTPPNGFEHANLTEASLDGQMGCRVDGTYLGTDISAIVVPHPYPFELNGDRYGFAGLISTPDRIEAIATSADFSPELVTPDAYIMSVIDIAEARSYWTDRVDWELVRDQARASIDGLPSLELARGTILSLIQWLRAAGDNHSLVVFPDQPNRLRESAGFGMLVGGNRVLLVYEGSPADRAGVNVGDEIVSVDGQPLIPFDSVMDPANLANTDSAQRWIGEVLVTLRRDGFSTPLTVSIGQEAYSLYAAPAGRRTADDIGYVAIPLFREIGREVEYTEAGNAAIESIDQERSTCGWVVDLRINEGGSFYPMISSVGSILGDGIFYGYELSSGQQRWVTLDDGRIIDNGRLISEYVGSETYELENPNPPVAVLTSSYTGSSGEVTALAFVKRPGSRLFGEQTAGATTSNRGHLLFDGTLFLLANAAMTDRTGTTHLDGIEPDEYVAIDWNTFGTENDPVLNAALKWLNEQPACAESATPAP